MNRSLDVIADLSLVSGGGIEISVKADGNVIELGMEKVTHGYALANRTMSRQNRAQFLEHLQAALTKADLTLHVRIAKRVVALLTPSSRPTLLAKLSGVAPVEIKPLALFLAILKL